MGLIIRDSTIESQTCIDQDSQMFLLTGARWCVQCLRPWLDSLENPSTVKANLQGLNTTLNGPFKTQLGLLKTDTDSLVVRRFQQPQSRDVLART